MDLAGNRYRPINGTEGHAFEAAWCAHCERGPNGRPMGALCGIVHIARALDVADPGFPRELRRDALGRPECTAFVPLGNVPPERCTHTGDLFKDR